MKKPKGRNDGHETDYSIITDQIIVGSNFCKGELCTIHSEEFKHLGVDVEINLDNEKREVPPDFLDSYTWLPVVDGYAPSLLQLEIGSRIIDAAVKAGKKVYVHCRNGHGRGPTMVAAYLIKYCDMTVDEANALIKEKRPESHIEDEQIKALKEFIK